MDGLDHLASSVMQSFSAADPFMFVNVNGICGCSRVLQTRRLAISTVSAPLRFHFQKEAGTPSAEQEPFAILYNCVKAIDSLTEGSQESLGYQPILFRWEVVESSARTPEDYGRLVFSDPTATRFIVVENYQSHQHKEMDLVKHAKNRADLLFCLLTYTGFNPKWVRFTTFTEKAASLPKQLLQDFESNEALKYATHGFGQVDASNFRPSLDKRVLEKIEHVVQRTAAMKESITKDRDEFGGRDVLRARVFNSRGVPFIGPETWVRVVPQCPNCCRSGETTEMLVCSGCKIAHYCSRTCQKAHWKAGHKYYCKQK